MSDTVPAVSPELLVAANRACALEAVIRWMLHDLRNPLQTLTLLPALADSESEPGAGADWRDALSSASARLALGLALLDRLMAAPVGPPTIEPVAVAEVLGFLAELFGSRPGRFCVTVEPAGAVPLPAVAAVRGDLELALLNLLLNAAEASGDQAGRATVLTRSVLDGGELVFEDDGPGIPEELRARLFEPLVTTRPDGPVRGLGLFVARHLLARAGGELRYEAANAGSRFIVRLPAWRPRPER